MKTPLIAFTLLSALCICQANQVSESQQQYITKYAKQKTVPKPEDMLLNTDQEPELTEGFTPLFNGKDLSDWTRKGGTHTFDVQDGVIVGTCVPGSSNTFLCTEKEFSNFIFTCEMKWVVDGNSGVMIRARARTNEDGSITVYGPQVEMEGLENERDWSGGIYGEAIGGWLYPLWLDAHAEVRKALKADAWNRLTVIADGETIKTWVNGIPAANWQTSEYMKGFFGLQIHAGNEGTVQWRNIKIKELQ